MRFQSFNTRTILKFILIFLIVLLGKIASSQDTDYTENSLLSSISSNTPTTKAKALTIGDKVPDIEFKMVNYQSETAKLSDFTNKGKLVILDFWATWCSSCVGRFPKLDSLQKKYNNKLQIILVNSSNSKDTEEKIADFFFRRRAKNGEIFQLPSAIKDVSASILFPHAGIPHYVWITADQKVKAITSAKQITEKNIESILDEELIVIPVKKDFFANKLLDLSNEVIIDENLMYYSFFKKGKFEGLKAINRIRIIKDNDGKGNIRGSAMRNMPLLEMYKTAIYLNANFNKVFSDKRLILEIKDSLSLIYDQNQLSKEDWEKKYLYTYDLVIPACDSIELSNYIIKDLNTHSGYYAKIEKRRINCLELVHTGSVNNESVKKISSVNPGKGKQVSLSINALIERLNHLSFFKLPIISKVNFTGSINVELPNDLSTVIALRRALYEYGLDIIETKQDVDMFVIREK